MNTLNVASRMICWPSLENLFTTQTPGGQGLSRRHQAVSHTSPWINKRDDDKCQLLTRVIFTLKCRFYEWIKILPLYCKDTSCVAACYPKFVSSYLVRELTKLAKMKKSWQVMIAIKMQITNFPQLETIEIKIAPILGRWNISWT